MGADEAVSAGRCPAPYLPTDALNFDWLSPSLRSELIIANTCRIRGSRNVVLRNSQRLAR